MDKRIPFGYDIIDGRPVINERKRRQLLLYFKTYLAGQSMADAARTAHLPVCSSTYPNLFKRKEYCGTEDYPAMITKDYQTQLVAEWQRRKDEHPRRRRTPAVKGVKVYTHFKLASARAETGGSPADIMAVFYQRIRPDYTHNLSNKNTNHKKSQTLKSQTPSSK